MTARPPTATPIRSEVVYSQHGSGGGVRGVVCVVCGVLGVGRVS